MTERAPALRARLRHRIPGRTRIRLEPPLASPNRLERLADELSALAGVRAVDINPATGSILLRHEHAYDPVIAASESRLLEILAEPKPEPVDPVRAIGKRIGQVDAVVGRLSGGRMDAWGLAFAGLVAGGLVQLARGQVAGPAITLFGQAATLAMAQPLRMIAR